MTGATPLSSICYSYDSVCCLSLCATYLNVVFVCVVCICNCIFVLCFGALRLCAICCWCTLFLLCACVTALCLFVYSMCTFCCVSVLCTRCVSPMYLCPYSVIASLLCVVSCVSCVVNLCLCRAHCGSVSVCALYTASAGCLCVLLCESRLGCSRSVSTQGVRVYLHLPAVCLCQLTSVPCAQSCVSSTSVCRLGVPRAPPRVPALCLRLRRAVVPGCRLRVRVRSRRLSASGARWRRRMRARGGGGGGRGAARGRPGGGSGRAGGRAVLRCPAAAGSNGEAGAAPANYISETSIIRGKTRKRWRPAPGGPLPERPGPSLLLRPPSSPRRPRPAPPPPRPRPRPHGRTLGRAAAGRAQPPPPPMRLVARLQVGPADTQPRGKFSAAG